MNQTELWQGLLRELDRTQSLLTKAKQDFLDVGATYDSRGRGLEQAADAKMEEYLRPENNRAKALQQAAERIQQQNRQFLRTRASLTQQAALLLMALTGVVLHLTLEAILPDIPDDTMTGTPLEVARAFMKALDRSAARNLLIGARAVMIGGRVAAGITEATDVIQLRQTRLEAFCIEVFSIDVSQRVGAVGDIIKDEVQEEVARAIVESAAELLGVGVETVLPVVKIARIGFNLHAKLRAIKERNRRSEVDEMMDLDTNLTADDKIFDEVLKLLQDLSAALADGSAVKAATQGA